MKVGIVSKEGYYSLFVNMDLDRVHYTPAKNNEPAYLTFMFVNSKHDHYSSDRHRIFIDLEKPFKLTKDISIDAILFRIYEKVISKKNDYWVINKEAIESAVNEVRYSLEV